MFTTAASLPIPCRIALLVATLAGALTVGEVAVVLASDHAVSGSTLPVEVLVRVPDLVEGTVVRVVARLRVDVAARGEAVGERLITLLDRPLAGGEERIAVAVPTIGVLVGEVAVGAHLVRADGQTLAAQWSRPAAIGVRPVIDLAGAWTISEVRPLEGPAHGRPDGWTMATPPPESWTLPGSWPLPREFRGWVTARREIAWALAAGMRPRFARIAGASDSVALEIDGAAVGETLPIAAVQTLSTWSEFHSPFKGDDHAERRSLVQDLGERPPTTFLLPNALPDTGRAACAITVRGTSGTQFRTQPAYGVLGSLRLVAAGDVHVRHLGFSAGMAEGKRRFRFALTVANEGAAFTGRLRVVYGAYAGATPYTGACPAYAEDELPLSLPPGASAIEVVRDEIPRFATLRATMVIEDARGAVIDAEGIDVHAVAVEIRDQRDLLVNGERFILKGQGSDDSGPGARMQLRLKGGNAFRQHGWTASPRHPGLVSAAASVDSRLGDGLLTSAGPLLASCEKCTFWDPAQPERSRARIRAAVAMHIDVLGACPGVIMWEATNELHGESAQVRIEIQEAFHELDPYRRPVLATKGTGEWEAEAVEGRVEGVDIVGCQYLLSAEAAASVAAAITDQPLMSTEVNWFDGQLRERGLFAEWLRRGVCGSLMFDYVGDGLQQPLPTVPPPLADAARHAPGTVVDVDRALYQDLVAQVECQADGSARVLVSNRMPFPVRDLRLSLRDRAGLAIGDLASGEGAAITLPATSAVQAGEALPILARYHSHGGLPSLILLAPRAQGVK